jgi:hypothetical protein
VNDRSTNRGNCYCSTSLYLLWGISGRNNGSSFVGPFCRVCCSPHIKQAVLSFGTLRRLWKPHRRYAAILTADEDKAINNLLLANNNSAVLNDEEQKEMGAFVLSILGSKDFNGRALARAKVIAKYDKPKCESLKELATVAHKTQHDAGPLIEVAEAAWVW